jgi:cyclic lactone autoinducer peptide
VAGVAVVADAVVVSACPSTTHSPVVPSHLAVGTFVFV